MECSKSSTEFELGSFSTGELFSMLSFSDKVMSFIQGTKQSNAKVEKASFSCALIADLRIVKTQKVKCLTTGGTLQTQVPYLPKHLEFDMLLSTFFLGISLLRRTSDALDAGRMQAWPSVQNSFCCNSN